MILCPDLYLLYTVCKIIGFCREHESVQNLASSSFQKCLLGVEGQNCSLEFKALKMGCRNIDWGSDNSNLWDLQVPFGMFALLPLFCSSVFLLFFSFFWVKKPKAWFSLCSPWLWIRSTISEFDAVPLGEICVVKFRIRLLECNLQSYHWVWDNPQKICCAPLLARLQEEEEGIQHRDTFSPSFLTIRISLLKCSVLNFARGGFHLSGVIQKSELSAVMYETSDLCCLQWHFGAFKLEELSRHKQWAIYLVINIKTLI